MVVSVHKKEFYDKSKSSGIRSPHSDYDETVREQLSRKKKLIISGYHRTLAGLCSHGNMVEVWTCCF